jgi:PleD family two-component response regulator
VKHLPRVLADIRQLSQTLVEASDLKSEMRVVEDLARKVGFLTQMASMAECPELAQLASALELLFFHLHETKSLVEDSCRNTIAVTVAFLTKHLEHFDPLLAKESLSASILIVNDDLASNRALVHALTHANLSATSLTDPTEALEQLRYTAYNLIIVDVELPLMNGLALCEQIRGLDLHRLTPVIFITSRNDLKTRARYTLSGGDDFISKPVLPIELTVKVITHLLKSRVGK